MNPKQKQLFNYFKEKGQSGICIAFSGGVDSSLLLKIASQVKEETKIPVHAVIFETTLHPHGDILEAENLAKSMNVYFHLIAINEFSDPEILHNPVDRCYRCKKLLFQELIRYASLNNCSIICDGTNYDDLNFYRPGIKALKELQISSPLIELEITKKEIREMAKDLSLSVSQKPSAPCLATRIPYNTELDMDVLKKLDQGEQFLRELGFYNVRLRLHDSILRIEIDSSDFNSFIGTNLDHVISYLKDFGFDYITLDLEGFRSGSMDIHKR